LRRSRSIQQESITLVLPSGAHWLSVAATSERLDMRYSRIGQSPVSPTERFSRDTIKCAAVEWMPDAPFCSRFDALSPAPLTASVRSSFHVTTKHRIFKKMSRPPKYLKDGLASR
jgi:hypothetical protein